MADCCGCLAWWKRYRNKKSHLVVDDEYVKGIKNIKGKEGEAIITQIKGDMDPKTQKKLLANLDRAITNAGLKPVKAVNKKGQLTNKKRKL